MQLKSYWLDTSPPFVGETSALPVLLPDCLCHFYDEAVPPEILFCNQDCRDDHDRSWRPCCVPGDSRGRLSLDQAS